VQTTAGGSTLKTSRRVAATEFRWRKPLRPASVSWRGTGFSVHRNGPRGDCSVSYTTGNSGGPPLPMGNRGSCDLATLAIFPEYVEFDARDVLQYVMPPPAGRKPA